VIDPIWLNSLTAITEYCVGLDSAKLTMSSIEPVR
jgi:hypothetical protein